MIIRSIALLTVLLVCCIGISAIGQIKISGIVTNASTGERLPYVNIGIKHKNIGTVSLDDGTFTISLSQEFENDTLTFSIVGFGDSELLIRKNSDGVNMKLAPKMSRLNTVFIRGEKLTEETFGIVKYHPIIHFTDGSTNQHDIFEIAQLIKTDTDVSKITAVSLYISESRKDSGRFRINFYNYDGKYPGSRIIERSIVQVHSIKKGWLKFDLTQYGIYLKGNFIVGIEFIPSGKETDLIAYEVKLGGSAKSFVRSRSQGDWKVPPHHYRMFVTALVTGNSRKRHHENTDENESIPAFRMFSNTVGDSFSIFVKVPQNYVKNKHYPVIYLLDANAYFDQINYSGINGKKRTSSVDAIFVGVGYADFVQNDSLRNRDYTYPVALPEDSFRISGGADRFLGFLTNELIPVIDSTYSTDTINRTIIGHSLGGYFSLYALTKELEDKHCYFHHFVAASPSLSYHKDYLLSRLSSLRISNSEAIHRTLYITVGGLENANQVNTIDNKELDTFIQKLKMADKDIEVHSEVYPDYSHMETAVRTFNDAILWLMKK